MLASSVLIAIEGLARHATRTLLATLGVIIGVASVIVMLGLAQGTRLKMEAEVRKLGANRLGVRSVEPRKGGVGRGLEAGQSLTLADVTAVVRGCGGVRRAAPRVRLEARIKHGNRNVLTDVMGVTNDYFPIRNFEVEAGRAFLPQEAESRARVCLLGPVVSRELFRGRPPLGQTVAVNGQPYRVIGLLAERGGADASWDELVWVPVETAMERIFHVRHIDRIDVETVSAERMAEAQSQIEVLLRRRHRIRPGARSDFEIRSQQDVQQAADETGRLLTSLLAGIASVSLVVGGIGIMNIMLVSVAERTREIGVRRAVGARRGDIVAQFFVEAVAMCGAGAAAGVGCGLTCCWIAARVAGWPMAVEPLHLLLACGCAVATGLLFGIYPALRAGGLSPQDALRHA